MDEISLATQELATSQQRGISSFTRELWEELRLEAVRVAAREEILRGYLDVAVLRPSNFAFGLGSLLARKLGELSMPVERLGDLALAAMADEPAIIAAAAADLVAIRTRDPAAESYLTPFLYYKGFHALQWHRVGLGCGATGAGILPISCKAAYPKSLPSISIPRCRSETACLSTTVPVSLSARLRSSATTFQSCMR